MPTFPSQEWFDAYCATLLDHPEIDAMARSLDGVYRFTVQPDGPLPEPFSTDLEIRPGPPPAVVAGPEGDVPPTLAIAASYTRWRDLITGRADFLMSFLMRRVRIEGDLSLVRSRIADARPLLDSLHRVETEFI